MGFDFLIHVLGVRLFVEKYLSFLWIIWVLFFVLFFLISRLWLDRFSIESLLVYFLIFDLIDNFIGADLDFFQNVVFVTLSLNLDCLVDHLTQLFVSLVQFAISFD